MKAVLFAAAAIFAAPAAYACSVDDEYRVPTNLELAEQADTILVGTVTGPGVQANKEHPWENGVVFAPSDLLKGPALPGPIKLPGMIATGRYAEVRSDPNELRDAHPLAYIGGCVRYMFPKGAKMLVFFVRGEGDKLVPIGAPFARTAEDVTDTNARWAKAVKLYVAVAALPVAERKAGLIARRDALLRDTSDPDARAIAKDIDVELASPNETWNQLMEREIKAMKHDG